MSGGAETPAHTNPAEDLRRERGDGEEITTLISGENSPQSADICGCVGSIVAPPVEGSPRTALRVLPRARCPAPTRGRDRWGLRRMRSRRRLDWGEARESTHQLDGGDKGASV